MVPLLKNNKGIERRKTIQKDPCDSKAYTRTPTRASARAQWHGWQRPRKATAHIPFKDPFPNLSKAASNPALSKASCKATFPSPALSRDPLLSRPLQTPFKTLSIYLSTPTASHNHVFQDPPWVSLGGFVKMDRHKMTNRRVCTRP